MTASYELAPVVDTPIDRPRYSVSLAQDEAEVRAAQRLRHQVFAGEMGAVLDTPSRAWTSTPSTPTATTCW